MLTSSFVSQPSNTSPAQAGSLSEADIRWAIDTVKYDGCLEGDTENNRLLIGFDRNANPFEIYYNILDSDTVLVFHAMKCRSIHKYLLENE